jgi:prephenate dehydrogenase
MTELSRFSRIAVIGTGLIGGSFALAARKQLPQAFVLGWDRDRTALDRALRREAVHDVVDDLATAIHGADLVFIALPVGATIEVLPAISRAAGPRTLVTDAGSTKAQICKVAYEHFRGEARFLGGHPMAGKEQSGVEHATADLFRSAPYGLIGSEETPDERVRDFAALVRACGANPVWCDPETHDWSVGIVSHLPQLAAIALGRVIEDETDETQFPLALAGQGLQDSLRLAGSPYTTWRDIVLTNTDNISRALDRLSQAIEHLRQNLRSKELEQEFAAANELYKKLKK